MNLQVIILIITIFMIINTYYDGKYITLLKSWKKYYIMIGYLFFGGSIMYYIKKNPNDGHQLLQHATNSIKYMPIDKSSTDFLSPVLNHVSSLTQPKQTIENVISRFSSDVPKNSDKPTKRSVGETKKKYVAANQNWTCAHCKCKLPAWFEVDHVKRLQYGGSNDISNLEALCRECHGKKTAEEHLNII